MNKYRYLFKFTAAFEKELLELLEISAGIFGISVVVWRRVVVSSTTDWTKIDWSKSVSWEEPAEDVVATSIGSGSGSDETTTGSTLGNAGSS
jgi:hypothetical protein